MATQKELVAQWTALGYRKGMASATIDDRNDEGPAAGRPVNGISLIGLPDRRAGSASATVLALERDEKFNTRISGYVGWE